MSTFFPQFPSQTFAPFFHEIGSFFPSESFTARPQQLRPFTPRFDVQEIGAAYELHGELPGINREDINIEFVDANTLVIKGKTERSVTRTQNGDVKGKTIEGLSLPDTLVADNASEKSTNYHKASVEDEYIDAGAEREGAGTVTEGAPTPASSNAAEVTAAPEQPPSQYWVSERSVGEFQRTFSFPGKVDQEAVKASLKNGILSIIVPKLAKQERKIAIE
ncbi:MAG: hypothetical protein Q9182_000197 [Xanthomendoza sp. 2 TL-2023]